MDKNKCYHMTSHLKEILEQEESKLKPMVGKNSEYVNDTKEQNIGISYSLGLEGIIATNAMFLARYQYNLLENQTDKDITLEDMFNQEVQEKEQEDLGSNIYLTFDETDKMKKENLERDIADPKTKSEIDAKDIRGVVLKNKNGEIKFDRASIIRYAVSRTNVEDIVNKLDQTDRPYMNIPGYGKTDFSFKEYVQKYYEEILKDTKTLELQNDGYELQEIDVNELLNMIEKDREKEMPKGKSGLEDAMQDDKSRTNFVKSATQMVRSSVEKSIVYDKETTEKDIEK